MTMRITVLGTDYEGLVVSVGLALMGHEVTAVDTDRSRARRFQRGMVSVDGELARQMKDVLRDGHLRFTSEPETVLPDTDIVFISGIPGLEQTDLPDRMAILRTAECLTGAIGSFRTVLVTARVPTGSCRLLQDWIDDAMHSGPVDVVAFPVFFGATDGLKEFLHPDRIVLGYEDERARRILDELFANQLLVVADLCHVSWEAAEMMRSPEPILAPALPVSGSPATSRTYSDELVYARAGNPR